MTSLDSSSDQGAEYVRVKLFGREYGIRGHGDRNYIQKIADYITEKSERIQRETSVVSTLDLSVLTLLNITYEMFQDKESKERTIRELEEKNRQNSRDNKRAELPCAVRDRQ